MNVLVSGCSFTNFPFNLSGPKCTWPFYIERSDLIINNVGSAGAGNQYIADSVVRNLNNSVDHVLVMWSGVSRLDILTSTKDSAWNNLLNNYGFTKRIGPDLAWVHSGGNIGPWYNSTVHDVFYELYKVNSDLSLATVNLMEILRTQEFLKRKGVNYHFMSYVNYWGSGNNISSNGDFGIRQFEDLKFIVDQIDFGPWIFLDDKFNGIYELAKKNNDFQLDGFHPGCATSRQWADIVIQRLG